MTRELTKIELFCEDNSVGRIQRLLVQVKGVYDVKAVPVVNAVAKADGRVKAETGGNVMEQFAAYLTGKEGESIALDDIRGWLERVGRSPASYGYVLKRAVQARLLTKKGKGAGMTYTVRS